MRKRFLFGITGLLVTACVAPVPAPVSAPVPVFEAGAPCETGLFTVVDGFSGARRGDCEVIAADTVQVSIAPEDDGYINPSPWYAFKLVPAAPSEVVATLKYVGGKHRYVPKISRDGANWTVVNEDRIEVSADRTLATIRVTLENTPVWIAAQELMMPAIYDAWIETTAASTGASSELLGYSALGRPIRYLENNGAPQDVLLLVGRQHPPEVSGSFAFFSFTETLLADTDLAKRFRTHFHIVAIPLLNPDGVVAGHWRHNLGSTDLNRDWGFFIQPETRLIGELLDSLDADQKRIRLFLDFHSTDRNLFYTQDETAPTDPPDFYAAWFDRVRPRLEGYPFSNEARGVERPGVAKNYMYRRYGIPAATYEVGDETDREATRAAAVIFAEELMSLMLETLVPDDR